MTKRYLLLRNNLESGPFTIDELLQQHLSAKDLLWEEGASHEWKYLKEVIDSGFSSINHNIRPFPTAVAANKFAAIGHMEEGVLNQQIENDKKENWNPALSDPSSVGKKPRGILQTDATKEEENIEFIYHRRKKANPFLQLAVLAMIVIVMAIGWHRNGSFFKTGDAVDQAAIPLVSSTEHTAMAPKPVTSIRPAILSTPADSERKIAILTDSSAIKVKKETVRDAGSEKPAVARIHKKPIKKMLTPSLVAQRKEDVKIALPGDLTVANNQPLKEIVLQRPQEPTVVTDKKKSLGQVLKGLFHKKKKEEKTTVGTE